MGASMMVLKRYSTRSDAMNSGTIKCPKCGRVFTVGTLAQHKDFPKCPQCGYVRKRGGEPCFTLVS